MVSSKALNLLPLSVHSGHDRTCRWHDPVANDTLQTLVDPSSIRYQTKDNAFAIRPSIAFLARPLVVTRRSPLWRVNRHDGLMYTPLG
jgi:hypothetical protein